MVKNRQELIDKLKNMSDEEFKKYQGQQSDDAESTPADPPTPPAPPAPPIPESEEIKKLNTRIAELEARNKELESESVKLRSTDSKVQAIKRALPYTDTSNMSVDEIGNLYTILRDNKQITDEVSKIEDQLEFYVNGYNRLLTAKLALLKDSLIEATKESAKPETEESIDALIQDWEEKENLNGDEIEDRLVKRVQTALNFRTQEVADKVRKKFGLPHYVPAKDESPFNASDVFGEHLKKGGKI